MKILFLTNQLEIGGIETNLVRLTAGLTQRGHDVVVAAAPGALVDAIREAGARFVPLALNTFRDQAAHAGLAALLREELPDIVHVFSATTAWVLRRALAKIPAHARPPVMGSLMGFKDGPGESAVRAVLRGWMTTWGVDRVLVIAPSFELLLRWLPVRRGRLQTATLIGMNLPGGELRASEAVDAVRAELGLSPGDRLVTTVGALEPRKSHELFIRGAAEVARQRNDVQFVIVGGGSLQAGLQNEIDRLGVSDQVRMVGQRTDALRFIAASDVYVRPAVVEGFAGITVLEAQALRVPVISFDTRDVRLAIEPEISGVLVRRRDTTALAGAVMRLLDDPTLAARLAEAGHGAVCRRFALDAVVDELQGIYAAAVRH